MFESSSKSRKSLEWMTDDLAMSSRYLKQQMKMIWMLQWWFHVEEHILTKLKKSGVLAPVHTLG